MAGQPRVDWGVGAPADPHVAYWADREDEPIALTPFDCCGRYVCRCGDSGQDRADLFALAQRVEVWVTRYGGSD